MQKFVIDEFRASGDADEIWFRTGTRDSRDALRSMFIKAGAVEDGELYRLKLE